MAREPIAAIATAAGRGAVGIVRVSGPDVSTVIAALCGRLLPPRQATYLPFRALDASAIDQGLAIHFPAPHSYTGEDVLELQGHGGPVVMQLLLARCLEAGAALGLRLARPGEFSERAFLNGKLDLAQAEAVADLIDASTEAAARAASRSLAGEFSREVDHLRDRMIHLRMLVEATLDFPEEELDFLGDTNARDQLSDLQEQLATVMQKTRQGALLQEGLTVVIAGQPNVGKSSLLNALAGAELAIVTPVAGTTRDKIAQTIQIQGVALHVIDTAGLRDSDDSVEQIGIARAWREIESADAVLFLHDLTRQHESDYLLADAQIQQRLIDLLPARLPIIHLWNKADAAVMASADAQAMQMSAKTGAGLDTLRQRLLAVAGWQTAAEGNFSARLRHVQALQRAAGHLEAAKARMTANTALDLLAEELRLGHQALGEVTGAFSADDLLGVIFSKFCIGK
jgi:tRNA modification GTPase